METFYAKRIEIGHSILSPIIKYITKIFFLFLCALFVLSSVSLRGQTITTDKVDYLPGDEVVASGNGWEPFEIINLSMEEQELSFSQVPLINETITCDSYGNFTSIIYEVVNADLGAFFHLTAIGSSGHIATITFNDAGGDYAIDFSAYDPEYYDRYRYADGWITTPILGHQATSPLNVTDHDKTVESLMAEHLGLGQIVAFEYFVRVDDVGSCVDDSIRIDGEFLTVTTNGGAFGFDGNVGMIAAFVDGSGPGIIDGGNLASVYDFNWVLNGDIIETSVFVEGLDPGDEITIEVWLVLQEYITESVGGNVKTRLGDAASIGACEPGKINTGNQEVPFRQVGGFYSADVDVSIDKVDDIDPVPMGEQFTYTMTIYNMGPSVANEVVVTDVLDPHTTYLSHNFIDPVGGAIWEGGLQLDGTLLFETKFLNPGESSVIEVVVEVNSEASTPTTGAGGSGPCTGVEDLCNNVSFTSISDDRDLTNNLADEPTGVYCPEILISTTLTNETCFENDDGRIDGDISGGSADYTVDISGVNLPVGYPTPQTVSVTNGSFVFDNLPAGSYDVNVVDVHGCQGSSENLIITQPDQLIVTISGEASVCYGGNVDLTSTVEGGISDYSYNWYEIGDPVTSLGTNASINVSPLVSSTYVVVVSDVNSCTATNSHLVTVNDNPECDIAGTMSVCPESSDQYLGPADAALWEWSISGDGVITSVLNAVNVAVLAGTTCDGQYTLYLTTTSAEGCISTCEHTVYVGDTISPVLVSEPVDVTVACVADIPAMIDLSWTDNCDVEGSVTGVDSPLNFDCEGTITRTWIYADGCFNSDTAEQIITIEYEDFAIGTPNGGETVDCIGDVSPPIPPEVYDNCGNMLTPVGGLTEEGTYDNCEGTIIYRYTYTDCEQNFHDWTYTYTIEYEDFAIGTPNGSETVDCFADVSPPIPPTVYDNCGNMLTPVGGLTEEGTYDNCEGTIIYRYTYTDCEQNSHDWTYTYTIEYEDFAIGTPNGGETVDCIADVTSPIPPEVYDNCGNMLTPVGGLTEEGTYDNCEGTIIYRYTYTDCEQNSHDWTYTYTIEYEDFAIGTPNGSETVDCIGDVSPPIPPEVYDNCGNMLTPVGGLTEEGTYDNCEGTVIYRYTYTDCEQNSHDWTYTYTIEYEDFVIGTPNGSETVDCIGDVSPPIPPEVYDNCGNMLTPVGGLTEEGTYDNCEGTIIYRYTYTDCEQNSHDWTYTYTIEYEDFAIGTPNGGETVDCIGDVSQPIPPEVYDNCGNMLTPVGGLTEEGTYDNCEGTIIYRYTYTDCEQNSNDWTYTYTIEYEDFAIGTPNGGETVDCIADVTSPIPPEVYDNCGNMLTPVGGLTEEGTYDNCEGTIIYRYTYTDCEQNSNDWTYTYTIEYEDFAIGTPNGGETVDCIGDVSPPIPPEVYDNCGNMLTPVGGLTEEGTYDNCEGTIIYRYTYTDCEQNSHDWTYTYTIEYEDFAIGTPNGGETVDCFADVTSPIPPEVYDNCGNMLTPVGGLTEEGTYDNCEGTIIYRYTYTDCEQNSHDWTYTYTIEYEDFVIGTPNGSETVACIADVTSPIPPEVYDNCGNMLTPVGGLTEEGTYDNCEGTIIYRYTYTDCEQNSHDWTYTYTIEYEDFAIGTPNGGETVDCIADVTSPIPPEVYDNCGNMLTPVGGLTEEGTYDNCEGTIIYRYTYTDCEQNSNDWTYTYTIEYEDFAIGTPNGSETVDCIGDVSPPIPPEVYDNCGNMLTPVGGLTEEGTYDNCEGTIIYRYTYTDCEQNSNDWTYTYTIEYEDFVIGTPNGGETVDCFADVTSPIPPEVYDNCGNMLTPVGGLTEEGTYDNCEGTIIYRYTYTDCEQNSHDWTYTYTIEYEDFAIGTPNGGETVDCIGDVSPPIPPEVYDNCGNMLTPVGGLTEEGTYDECEGTIIYRYTYTDCEQNSHDWTYTYIIEYEDFAIGTPNGSETVDCIGDVSPPIPPEVYDNCGNMLTPVGGLTEEGTYDECEGTIIYRYTYTDCEQNSHDWTYTYTIEYEDFAIGTPNGGETVDCIADVTSPIPPEVYDNCGNMLTPVGGLTEEGTYDNCEGTIIYRYTYTDCEQNSHDWTYTYTIEYEDFVIGTPNGSETVDCIGDVSPPIPPEVYDNCGNMLTPVGGLTEEGTYDNCEGTIIYRYTYTDCEQNSHDWTYTYTIEYEDFAIGTPNGGETVDCFADVTSPIPPEVYDNCGNMLTPVGGLTEEGTYDNCEGTIIYRYTYTDCEQNSHDWTYTYTIEYEDFVIGTPNGSETVDCIGDVSQPIPPEVYDNCGNMLTPVGGLTEEGTYDNCEGTIIYRYTYTDCEQNSHDWTYTYTIEYEDFAIGTPNGGETVDCIGDVSPPIPPEVYDNCGNMLTPVGGLTEEGTYDECEGTIIYRYTYTDCEQNSHDWTYTYIIEYEDFAIGTPNGSETVDCIGDVSPPIPPEVYDNCGNMLTPVGGLTEEGTYDECEGTIIYRYTYTDCEQNSHDWTYTYTIEYEDFAIGTPNGSETVACIADVTSPIPPEVYDNCGNMLTPVGGLTEEGTYDNCEGTIIYRYTYTDCEQNSHDWTYTYTIEYEDFVIGTPNGSETVDCIGDVSPPIPPEVYDNCGNMLTPVGGLTEEGTYDNCEGTIIYRYTYTDCEQNSHDWTYTYTIEYEDFAIGTPNGGETVDCFADVTSPIPPEVYDNCGNMLTPVGGLTEEGTYDNCEGTIIYRYTYTDCEQNSHDWTYTYTIEYEDFVIGTPNGSETVDCIGDVSPPIPPEVYDNCGNMLTPVGGLTEEGTYDNCEGTIIYRYTYTDCEQNSHDWTYTYTIEYEDFAIGTPNGGETVDCFADVTSPIPPEVYDNCGNMLTPVGGLTEEGTYDNCEGTIIYRYTYTDCEQNSHDWTYTYTIEYEDFVIGTPNGSETVDCIGDVSQPIPPEVYDNCGNMLTPVGGLTEEGTYDNCEGTIIYRYTYTDCEQNSHDWTYTYTIEYEDFAIGTPNGGETVDCIGDVSPPIPPEVYDNCGNMLTPVGGLTEEGTYDECEGTIIYRYTYTDCEQNSHDWTYTYIIEYEDFAIGTPNGSETVDCIGDVSPPIPPEVYDNCGNMLTPVGGLTEEGTYDNCEGTIIYRYTYTDCEQNSHDWTYTYTIEYEDFAIGTPNGGETVDCIADVTSPIPPEVYDNCGNMLTPVGGLTEEGTYDNCEGTIIYRYTYTDCEQNSHDWTYTYTIEYEDFVIGTPNGSETVDCIGDVSPPIPPEVYDNCGNMLTPVGGLTEEGTYDNCEGTIIYRYTYTDCEQNSHDWTYTYTIEYEDFAIGTPNGGETVDCIGDVSQPIPPEVYDNCGNMLTPVGGLTEEGTYDNCEGTIIYRYTYTDCEQNSHDWTYTYTIEYEDFVIGTPNGSETVDCIGDVSPPIPPEVYDNCGNMLTPVGGLTEEGTYDNCEGTIIYRYTYTDCEQNSHDWTYTYTIEYEDFAIGTPNGGETVDCIGDVSQPIPPEVYDNCGNMLTPVGGLTEEGTYDNCEGTIIYRYTYTDCEQNSNDWTYTYTIEYEDFAIGTPNGGETVDCIADVTSPIPPEVYDNCGNMLTPVGGLTEEGTYDNCEGTIIYRYTYTDCEQNSNDWTYTYTIEYEDFAIGTPNGGETVDCIGDVSPPIPPEVYDNCGNMLTPVGGLTEEGTYDNCEGTIIYRYTYTDCEQNSHDWTYTYTIEYEDFAIGTPNGGETVDCFADVTSPIPPEVYDNCGNMLTPVGGLTEEGTYDNCEGTIIYRYTYTDCEQNSHDWTYTYTIEYEDFVIGTPNGSETVACIADVTSPIPPEVYDNCGNMLTPVGGLTEEGTYDNCEGTIIYRYTYTDCEQNSHDWTYTYTIEYEDFAIGTPNGGETVDCIADVTSPIPPEVYDNCGNMLTPVGGLTEEGTYDNCEGTIIYRYTYTDCEQNSNDWTYTYTIEYEDFAIGTPNGSETVDCIGDVSPPIPPEVYDNCGNMLTPVGGLTEEGTYDNCEGTIIYRYTYTDCEQNSNDWTYTYTIEYEDFVIGTPNGGETVDCFADVTSPIPPEVYDNCGNMLTPVGGLTEEGTYDNCEGTIIYRYTYTDCEQNSHDWTYTYTIEYEDFVIGTPNGSETVACIADVTSPIPPEVYDNCGNMLTPVGGLTEEGTYDNCEGTIIYRYTYTDCEQNSHDWTYTYTIEYEDFVIGTPNGSETVDCIGDVSPPIPPEVYDNCGNMLTPVGGLTEEGTYDECEGTIIYRYTYTDCEQNSHDWTYTYIIEYEDFAIGTPNGSETVDCFADVTSPIPPEVYDNCGNMLTPVGGLTEEGTYDNCEGTIIYRYTYTDCEQNSHDWTYTYTIEYEDFVVPEDYGMIVACYESVQTPMPPVVVDNCGNSIIPVLGELGGTYVDCEGTITYPFTYTDCEGNSNTWTYTYTIEYEDFDMPDDASSIVECFDDAVMPVPPDVNDNCGVMITPVIGQLGGDFNGCQGTVIYPFAYTDCEGNSHIWTYTYNVHDVTDPVIVCPDDIVDGICHDILIEVPIAEDNCDYEPEVIWERSDGQLDLNAPFELGITTVTFIATDDCDNSSSCSMTVTIFDVPELDVAWAYGDQFENLICGQHEINKVDVHISGGNGVDGYNYEVEFSNPLWYIVEGNEGYVENGLHTFSLFTDGPDGSKVSIHIEDVYGCASYDTLIFLPCISEYYCSYTQGFYGNIGGLGCGADGYGANAYDIMSEVMMPYGDDPVLFGLPDNGWELYYHDITEYSIFNMLPGGGPSQAFNPVYGENGIGTFNNSDTWKLVPLKTNPVHHAGKIRNNLFAQTLTFFFNMEANIGFGNLEITDEYLLTADAIECGTQLASEYATWYTYIPESVVDFLNDPANGYPATAEGLFMLANDLLGASTDLYYMNHNKPVWDIAHSDVTAALDAFNVGFDECRIFIGFVDTPPEYAENIGSSKAEESIILDAEQAVVGQLELMVHPNPFRDRAVFNFWSNIDTYIRFEIYTLDGKLVEVLYDDIIYKDSPYKLVFTRVTDADGVYFYKVTTDYGTYSGKFVRQK